MTAAAEQLAEGVTLLCGDCAELLPSLDENSVDAFVGDPPYHLQSIVKRFAKVGRTDKTWSRSGPHQRTAAGFMNKKWDGGDIAFNADLWAQVWRVLKPGAHLVAFGGTRTYHRMACAIEDAGFEIRDTIMWVYGSGFPKSHDVSKAIDKVAGVERPIIGRTRKSVASMAPGEGNFSDDAYLWQPEFDRTGPATDAAREWQGWGTALKPAVEPIILARKPLPESTVAANVLKWGTGALNIDGCRVASDGEHFRSTVNGRRGGMTEADERSGAALGMFRPGQSFEPSNSPLGRWPANLIHDGSDEVVGAFPESKDGVAGARTGRNGDVYMSGLGSQDTWGGYNGEGSAARFFYTAKADADDRLGSKHPTVKPLDLMQYLVRLVTPPGGLVLDCFAGTGTTGEAAWREGMRAILIEREAEYQDDIRRRMRLALAGPTERKHESIKARGKAEAAGPLFQDGAA